MVLKQVCSTARSAFLSRRFNAAAAGYCRNYLAGGQPELAAENHSMENAESLLAALDRPNL
jgi:hypothetical protein